jgi:hypothetical protein
VEERRGDEVVVAFFVLESGIGRKRGGKKMGMRK